MEKSTLKKYAKIALVAFIGLYAVQSLYQALKSTPDSAPAGNGEIFESSRKNYATYSKKEGPTVPAQTKAILTDKYEKIARMGSRTSSFDEDVKQLTETLSKQKAVIQFESLKGLKGRRTYYLSAGVPPEAFDQTVEMLRAIGQTASLSIEKTDRTSEYLALLEKRASLERTKASLSLLKAKGGSMEESLKLENRLLEIEELLRNTNLGIGQFNAENEFCTVQFSLHETEGWTLRRTGHILVDAFVWTLALSVMLLFFLACALAGVWLLFALRNRLQRDRIQGPGV